MATLTTAAQADALAAARNAAANAVTSSVNGGSLGGFLKADDKSGRHCRSHASCIDGNVLAYRPRSRLHGGFVSHWSISLRA